MRRIALLGLLVLLPGCQYTGQYAGNPLDGFGTFIGDTHTFTLNPNVPAGDSENVRVARGMDTTVPPVLPEPGQVWPGPPPPIPTLSDVQKLDNQTQLPPPNLAPPPPSVFDRAPATSPSKTP